MNVFEGELTEEVVSKFKIVVLTDNKSKDKLETLAETCHAKGVSLIVADCWGVFGYCFVDLGVKHVVTDRTGER